ncbi:hypothetical protein BKA63DRAFT_527343 [Paraphoma chrysanthemicola]|nr:hypothetical protein BKA63DRAFT_527343 [Paraphoma chrysanthemicola]
MGLRWLAWTCPAIGRRAATLRELHETHAWIWQCVGQASLEGCRTARGWPPACTVVTCREFHRFHNREVAGP